MNDEDKGEELTPFELVTRLTPDDYVSAFRVLEPELTTKQRTMLLGHASAPGHTLSMESIAKLAGYASYVAANIQYGMLGGRFAGYFGIKGLANKTQALAYAGPEDDQGHWQWTMHPALVDALKQLGLVKQA